MPTNPQELRKNSLARRDALNPEELLDASHAICDRVLSLREIQNSATIFVYVSFRSEVATFDLIEKLLDAGKRVTVPITYVKERRLDAIAITDLKADLVPGYCNIPEPTPELCRSAIVSPDAINAILLPGSLFDKRGGRFGYGGGFYDRFVSAVPEATRIGLAFDLQIADEIPVQPHDEFLDYVITESQVYKGQRQ